MCILCDCMYVQLYVTSACGGPKRLLGAKPGSFVWADSAESPLQFLLFSSPLPSRKRLWGLCVHLAVWECRILQHFSSTLGKKGEKYGLVCPGFASVTKLQLFISPSRSLINSISTLIWPLKTKLNFKFKRKLKLLMKQLPGSG